MPTVYILVSQLLRMDRDVRYLWIQSVESESFTVFLKHGWDNPSEDLGTYYIFYSITTFRFLICFTVILWTFTLACSMTTAHQSQVTLSPLTGTRSSQRWSTSWSPVQWEHSSRGRRDSYQQQRWWSTIRRRDPVHRAEGKRDGTPLCWQHWRTGETLSCTIICSLAHFSFETYDTKPNQHFT